MRILAVLLGSMVLGVSVEQTPNTMRGEGEEGEEGEQSAIAPMQWQSGVQEMIFAPMNALLFEAFQRLYGDEEAEGLNSQLKRCQTQRLGSLALNAMRLTTQVVQLTTVCTSSKPDTKAQQILSQLINYFVPLFSPCGLDEDIIRDIVVWELLAYTNPEVSTQVQQSSDALLEILPDIFAKTDLVLANFTIALNSLSEKGVLDPEDTAILTELLSASYTSWKELINEMLANSDNLQVAIQTGKEDMEGIQTNTEDKLALMGIEQAYIDSLSAKMTDVVSAVVEALRLMADGNRDTDDADELLANLTSNSVEILRSSFLIMANYVTLNLGEFCESVTVNRTSTA